MIEERNRSIVTMHAAGKTPVQIAKALDVPHQTVSRIVDQFTHSRSAAGMGELAVRPDPPTPPKAERPKAEPHPTVARVLEVRKSNAGKMDQDREPLRFPRQ